MWPVILTRPLRLAGIAGRLWRGPLRPWARVQRRSTPCYASMLAGRAGASPGPMRGRRVWAVIWPWPLAAWCIWPAGKTANARARSRGRVQLWPPVAWASSTLIRGRLSCRVLRHCRGPCANTVATLISCAALLRPHHCAACTLTTRGRSTPRCAYFTACAAAKMCACSTSGITTSTSPAS